MPIPNQTDLRTLKIYTSTKNGGVQVYETPAASTGQQASFPATETPAAAGIVVPVRQVLGEYNEAGIFASIEGSAPAAGDVEGADTVVKVAAQSTSTGAQPPTDSTYLHAPWSTKSVV